jgi:hypothetical protein
MEEPSDFNSRLVFNMGNEAINVIIRDISFGLKLENIPPCQSDTNNPGDTTLISENIINYGVIETEFYPNPIQSGGIFKITSAEDAVVSYTITDCIGRRVEEKSGIEIPAGEFLIPMDFSSYARGIYILKVFTKDLTNKKISPSTLRILKN